MKASVLWIDGKPLKRQEDAPFDGPVGLSPQQSWIGCMPFADYVPDGLPEGRHKLVWQLGKTNSEEIRVKFYKPIAAAADAKDRLKQTQALRDALAPGLLKPCVENWLTERDGGLEIAHAVRYYVDPDVKVLVPYDQTLPQPHIAGTVKIYNESRVAD